MEQLEVKVSHTLDKDQLRQINEQVYLTTLEAIENARKDSKMDRDLLFSKNDVRKFLNNVSAGYLEELLSDPTFPRGKMLSERKQVFSKSAIRRWLLDNQN